uniref:DUF7153 domain-containing protein n=1 Tax=Ciona savignyi TaxID=51511 RepID=H2Y9C4_CIOSA
MSSYTVAPVANRYYLFNYFERPENEDLFQDVWRKGGDHVKKSSEFVATHLHHAGDGNMKFPWVNFAVALSTEVTFFKPDDWWKNYMGEVKQHKFVANPAGYREIGSYKGKELVADNKSNTSETARFFITAIKVAPNISDEDFESNWKELTGADFLNSQIPGDKLVDAHFYKRFMMSPAFKYTLRTEVNGIDDATGKRIADAANERAAKDGIQLITGFYKIAITVEKD